MSGDKRDDRRRAHSVPLCEAQSGFCRAPGVGCPNSINVTDFADQDLVVAAHARAFGKHPPAATMVGTPALVRAEWKVEIEVEAVVSGG